MDTLLKEKHDLKCSNIDWCGSIPMNWRVEKIKFHFDLSKERASVEDNEILSLTQRGIKVRDISGNEGQLAVSYDNYAKLRKGDIVLNPMDLITGYVDLADQEGIISPAYTILRKKKTDLNLEYAKHFFQWHYISNIFFPFGKGVSMDYRWTLGNDILLNFPILIPPPKIQEKIAGFLNKKTRKIDLIIDKKKELIKLLQEKRIATISKAVTKGFDSSEKMKDSGVDWIGDIPKKWSIRPLKELFTNRKETVGENYKNYQLLRLSLNGVYPKMEGDGGKNPERYDAYQIFKPNELVFCAFDYDVTPRTIGFVKEGGMMTGAYTRLIPKREVLSKYYYYYYLALENKKELLHLCTGLRNTLSRHIFWKLPNPYPNEDIQREIVGLLDKKTEKIDKFIKTIQEQIRELKEYRTSLIYNAVTGKIKI